MHQRHLCALAKLVLNIAHLEVEMSDKIAIISRVLAVAIEHESSVVEMCSVDDALSIWVIENAFALSLNTHNTYQFDSERGVGHVGYPSTSGQGYPHSYSAILRSLDAIPAPPIKAKTEMWYCIIRGRQIGVFVSQHEVDSYTDVIGAMWTVCSSFHEALDELNMAFIRGRVSLLDVMIAQEVHRCCDCGGGDVRGNASGIVIVCLNGIFTRTKLEDCHIPVENPYIMDKGPNLGVEAMSNRQN
ncbi:hypothetical protein BKA93DRAFT_750186 [Sparassis latifolia]